jgi:glucose-1-phosphate thymidylyltransferase
MPRPIPVGCSPDGAIDHGAVVVDSGAARTKIRPQWRYQRGSPTVDRVNMVRSAVLVAAVERDAAFVPGLEPRGARAAPLTPVLDRPIVAHALADLVAFGVRRIAILVDAATENQVAAAIADEPVGDASLSFITRDSRLGFVEAIAAARLAVGDGPLLLRFADSIGRDGLRSQLGSRRLGDFDAVALTSRFEDSAAGTTQAPSAISRFHVGVFALGAGFPSAFLTPEPGSSSWMESALGWMERQGGRIERRFVTGWWRHQEGPGTTLAANRFALAGIEGSAAEASLIDADVDRSVRCHPTARVESSVIRGPVWIGADAEVVNAFVGPFTAIGSRVRIEGAEIENSVVLEGSTISNVSGRLDSSVIGPHATVTKDFRLPRGTRLEVGAGARVSLQ